MDRVDRQEAVEPGRFVLYCAPASSGLLKQICAFASSHRRAEAVFGEVRLARDMRQFTG